MRDAVIVAAVRTAVGKAKKGVLRFYRPDDMAAEVLKEVIKRANITDDTIIDDIILGCAMPEAEQGMNVARIASLKAGISYKVPSMTVNRFCASGLQTIVLASERIMCGFSDIIIAGGTETMSLIPMGGNRILPNPDLVDTYPDVYLSMGLTAENVSQKYNVTREMQDEFAYYSHQKAINAIEKGYFEQEILPLTVKFDSLNARGKKITQEVIFKVDEGPRKDTTVQALKKLKPAFKMKGTVTAGNSSQMSDGASAVMVMSKQKADELNLKPLAKFICYATCGVLPEEMGIGPAYAIPKALKMANLTVNDIDLIELNEAFAAQAVAVINELNLNKEKVNVNGGAVALGHPLGCTGAKLTTTLLYEMQRRGSRYGMVSMCIGGGMGAAGIFERI